MARTFDGANDSLHTATGGLSGFTFGTFAAVIKRNGTTFHNIMTLHNSGGTSAAGMEIEDSGQANHLQYQSGGTFVRTSTIQIANADGWVLVAATKATGTATPRGHLYKYSTDAWTHENMSGTAANCTAPGSTGTMRFGEWETTDDYAGDIAVAGGWVRALADAELELLPFSLMAWMATAPDALWEFGQANTADKLLDLTGGGATESALTGTTVSTNSVPVFGYGHDVIVLSSSSSTAAGGTNAPAENAPVTFTANNTTSTVQVSAGVATIGWVAQNAQTAVAPAASAASVTLSAQTPSVAVAPVAGVATVGWTAQGATGGVAPTSGFAGIGWTARTPAAAVGSSGGSAAVGVAANGITSLISTNAQNAPVGAAAQGVGGQVLTNPTTAPLGVAARDAGPSVAPGGGLASVTWAGQGVTALISPVVGSAPINWRAQDATVSTSSAGSANAQVASWTIAAQDAGVSASPHAGLASIAWTARDATVITGTLAPAGIAVVSWSARDATASVKPGVGVAPVTWLAGDGTVAVGSSAVAGVAGVTWAARDITALITSTPGTASVAWQARSATVSIVTSGVVVSGGFVVIGLCGPWEPVFSCALPTGAATVSGNAVQAATEVLWALTAKRYGLCTLTLRPCRRDCADNPWSMWWEVGSVVTGPRPLWFNGTWFNVGCGCVNDCSCKFIDEVELPGPVHDIISVKVDGVTLTKNVDYRLDDYRTLVRLGDTRWPLCNDLTRGDTDVGTWSVTANFGEDVPTLGKMAVGALAVEFMKFLLCDESCMLPAPVQALVRQGVSITFVDPNQLFAEGKTGLYLPDLFINSVGGRENNRQRSRVYDLDGTPGNARLLGTG